MNDSADAHDPRDPRSDPRGEETGARSHGQDARSGDDRAAGRDLTRIERTRGTHPGDQFVRFRPHPDFRRLRSGHLVPSEESSDAQGGVGRTLSGVKRFLLGRPLTTAEERGERLGRFTGLSILASDNISSSAYATEEIMRVLVLAGVAALALTLPITLGICAVLAIVVLSYREVIRAYPGGGGSYVVAKDNLGPVAGLTAAAALLTDYVLTVSVSVAAGIAAITSALPGLADQRVAIMVAVVALVMVVNLRGVRESGRAFAVPTYVYLVAILGLVALGVFRYLTRSLPPYQPPAAWLAVEAGAPGALGLLLLLRVRLGLGRADRDRSGVQRRAVVPTPGGRQRPGGAGRDGRPVRDDLHRDQLSIGAARPHPRSDRDPDARQPARAGPGRPSGRTST